MNRALSGIVSCLCVLILILSGCGQSEIPLDYGDAGAFEAALNRGENLEGKTVRFCASELHPDSAFGYNVWAGEHLNFISGRNPDIKTGEYVDVRATEILSSLGSWIIKYEKIENAVISEKTIFSEDTVNAVNNGKLNGYEDAVTNGGKQTEQIMPEGTDGATAKTQAADPQEELDKIEVVDAGIEVFRTYGGVYVSAYMAVQNNSSINISFSDMRFEYVDDDGKLLSLDDMVNCIPEAIKPGQVGYIYSYYHDIDNVDLSNGFTFQPDGTVQQASNFYEIDVSDATFTVDSLWGINVIGRGTNNTNKDHYLAEPGAIFYDKNGNVMGFCYGIESFEAGQTKAFEIQGNLLSEEFDPKDVSTVKVYIQGDDWY